MAAGLLTLLMTCVSVLAAAQTRLPAFPEPVDVSRDQPVTSDPSSAVCGLPTDSTFCRNTTASKSDCRLCTGRCPTRTATPAHVDLLASVRSSSCEQIVTDDVNRRPNSSSSSSSSVLFRRSARQSNPTACYIRAAINPTLGSFTITFWIWPNSSDNGFVLMRYLLT